MVDVSVPLREAPGSSAALESYPGDSRTKPSRPAPLSSIFGLPSFSSLSWVSSLSLVSGLGSVLHFSRSSLQVDKQDGEFLPRPPQPDRDLRGLSKQAMDYF